MRADPHPDPRLLLLSGIEGHVRHLDEQPRPRRLQDARRVVAHEHAVLLGARREAGPGEDHDLADAGLGRHDQVQPRRFHRAQAHVGDGAQADEPDQAVEGAAGPVPPPGEMPTLDGRSWTMRR